MPFSEALDRGLKRSGYSVSQYGYHEAALADQLRLPETIGNQGNEVLRELLRLLDEDLEERGPWDWRSDITDGRHMRIAMRVVESQPLEVLLNAAAQFGWRRQRVKVSTFDDVGKGVQSEFASLLAERISKMLEAWRKDNVWNHEMLSRAEILARRRAALADDEKRPPALG